MPKENKSASRRSKRQCSEAHDENSTSSARESSKSTIGSNRYSPFVREVPRRESRMVKERTALSHADLLHSKRNGIIGNGIKYIMLPLHLLHFCIFGTSLTSSTSDDNVRPQYDEGSDDEKEEKKEEKEDEREKEKDSKSVKKSSSSSSSSRSRSRTRSRTRSVSLSRSRSRSPSPARRLTSPSSSSKTQEEKKTASSRSTTTDVKQTSEGKSKKDCSPPEEKRPKDDTRSDNDESVDDMVTAAEDSDSSTDYWSSANNTMAYENMSIDYDNCIDKSFSYPVLDEPMDISMEEHNLEKSYSGLKTQRDSRCVESGKNDASVGPSRKLCEGREEARSSSSVDEEIARIFQKQCTSSDDEYSSTSSRAPSCRVCSRQNKPHDRVENSNSRSGSRTKKDAHDNDGERKKKTTGDFVVNKRRKTVREDDVNEKRNDRKSEDRFNGERRDTREDTPSKRRSRPSRTPIKSKDTKRKEVKYRERATQTDSAFSDEDVEMIPIDAKTPEKRFHCKTSTRKSHVNIIQVEEMDQDLEYIADNEDSNDGSVKFGRTRVSSSSASFSSTDLGFEEHACTTPDVEQSFGRWRTNSPDRKATHRKSVPPRAPPGFPELPENPPLTSHIYNGAGQLALAATISAEGRRDSTILHTTSVPPAPTPMRHLYYDYPEFMDLPENISNSKILWNILKNNYYR